MSSSPSAVSTFTPAMGQPLPVPREFPVTWDDPWQAQQLWTFDRMHFGTPILPLVADVYRHQVASGFNRASTRYALPVHLHFLDINGFLYNCNPLVDAPPTLVQRGLATLARTVPQLYAAVQGQVVKRMTAKYMAHIAPVIDSLGTRWAQEWLPEVQEHLAFWHNFDLCAASLPALLAHLETTLQRIERLWALHFEILVPSAIAVSQFVDEYGPILAGNDAGPDAASDALSVFALLQAIDHSFLNADQALWQLRRQACILPAVRQTLAQQPAHAVIAQLAGHPEGQIFLAELRVWLEKYGQRGDHADGLSGASWLDDPTPVIRHLQAGLTDADQDLTTTLHAKAADLAQRTAQARRLVQNRAGSATSASTNVDAALAAFDRRLKAAQWGEFLLTEHHFWIDQQAMYRLRLVLCEAGRRAAAAGIMDAAEDVFYLTLDELFAGLRGAQPQQTLVSARRAEQERSRMLTPPDALGTMPWLMPPDEPFLHAMSRIFGGSLVPTSLPVSSQPIATQPTATQPTATQPTATQPDMPPVQTPIVVRGQAAASGKVRGTARVIYSLQDAARLQRGDILVTRATMPPWTPLLAIAGGVVTDVGGILSHAAIIARELRIPAVVATRVATATIQDGQLIEVDGRAGMVTIVE